MTKVLNILELSRHDEPIEIFDEHINDQYIVMYRTQIGVTFGIGDYRDWKIENGHIVPR